MTRPTGGPHSSDRGTVQTANVEVAKGDAGCPELSGSFAAETRSVVREVAFGHDNDSYGSETMATADFAKLVDDVDVELCNGAKSVGILGLTPVAVRLLRSLRASATISAIRAIYAPAGACCTLPSPIPVRDISRLSEADHDVLVVAADTRKEDLIRVSLPFLRNTPRIIVAGYGHLRFRDPLFDTLLSELLVPSLANGYPHALTHLYQCLRNAAGRRAEGIVAEFGMFKGGTTMFLSRVIEAIGMNWPVIGFDTFAGFPPRRSVLDMYDHPDCGPVDLPSVRSYLHGRNVEIVVGDIVETSRRLKGEDVILTFIDTDNYTPARAALDVVRERTIVGGAIVFDHFTGSDRFRYTLGERFVASTLLDDRRYFNLHGTGVFYRQA